MIPPSTSKSKVIPHPVKPSGLKSTTDIMEIIATTPCDQLHDKFGSETAEAMREAHRQGDTVKLRQLYSQTNKKTKENG
jgi:hypothetical protein